MVQFPARTIDDIASIAFNVEPLTLDAATDDAEPDFSSAVPVEVSTPAVEDALPEELARAVLVARVSQMHSAGKCPVPHALQARLLTLISDDQAYPFISATDAASCLQSVAAALSGTGHVVLRAGGLATTADRYSFGPCFTAAQLKAVGQSIVPVTAVAALITAHLRVLLPVADLAVGLSAEVLLTGKSDGAAFLQAHNLADFMTAHKGSITAAKNVEAVISGSKRVNFQSTTPIPSLLRAPQAHGMLADAVAFLHSATKPELAMPDPEPAARTKGKPRPALPPVESVAALPLAAAELIVRDVAAMTADRVARVAGVVGVDPVAAPQAASPSPETAFDLAKAVYTAVQALRALIATNVDICQTSFETEGAAKLAEMAAKEEATRAKLEAKKKELEAKGKKFNMPKAGKPKREVLLGDIAYTVYTRLKGGDRTADALAGHRSEFASFIDETFVQQTEGKPKLAKGTKDYGPADMFLREQVLQTIRRVFRLHGAGEIDTPVFELRKTLMGKYGEDSKLIFDLENQGGELLSLRYDLTVPFARFVAMHSLSSIRRFHVGKVYRRDNPAMNRGRFREFYQCDFDIAGSYGAMVPDADAVTTLVDILRALEVGPFVFKLSHRRLLDALLVVCGVPAAKVRPICSAIDKLDKADWPEVREEMVDAKGLEPAVADRIAVLVGDPTALRHHFIGPLSDILPLLDGTKTVDGADPDHAALLATLTAHPDAQAAVADLKKIARYLTASGAYSNVEFDLTLARGLDYYTGVIYEAVLTSNGLAVGSIAAGGRYDNLVGMFAGKKIPAVGGSIGVERVFAIKERQMAGRVPERETDVFVLTVGAKDDEELIARRMAVSRALHAVGISSEYHYGDDNNEKRQFPLAQACRAAAIVMIDSTGVRVRPTDIALDLIQAAPMTDEEIVPAVVDAVRAVQHRRGVRDGAAKVCRIAGMEALAARLDDMKAVGDIQAAAEEMRETGQPAAVEAADDLLRMALAKRVEEVEMERVVGKTGAKGLAELTAAVKALSLEPALVEAAEELCARSEEH